MDLKLEGLQDNSLQRDEWPLAAEKAQAKELLPENNIAVSLL